MYIHLDERYDEDRAGADMDTDTHSFDQLLDKRVCNFGNCRKNMIDHLNI